MFTEVVRYVSELLDHDLDIYSKSYIVSFVLTFSFGPIGLFYSNWVVAIIFSFIAILSLIAYPIGLIRNNLYHGAKFNGTWFDPERSKLLLSNALLVLETYKDRLGIQNA